MQSLRTLPATGALQQFLRSPTVASTSRHLAASTQQRLRVHFSTSRIQRFEATTVTPPIRLADQVEEPESLTKSIRKLVEYKEWQLCLNGAGIEKDFTFPSFRKALEFMNTVAQDIKSHKHHPTWTNTYNKVHVRWTTHKPAGLTAKDVTLAKICDEQAAVHQ